MISKNSSKFLRGIAILMVISSHYAAWMFVEPRFPWLRDLIMTLGVYGVDIFFAMSGYGLVKSAKKAGITKKYFWNRLKGSYLPYFLLVGTISLMDGVFDDLDDVISFLTGMDYWFMAVLFMTYILFMLCYKIGKWKEFSFGILLAGYTYYLYQQDYAYFWIVSNMTFLLGVILATLEEKFQKQMNDRRIQWGILLFSALGMWYFDHLFKKLGMDVMNTTEEAIMIEIFLSIFYTMTVIFITILLSNRNWKLFRIGFFELLGSYSLFIYLLHTRLYYYFIFKFKTTPYLLRVFVIATITILTGWILGVLYNKGIKFLEEKFRKRKKLCVEEK